MLPRVAIVVLNWNNPRDTLACLASLMHVTYDNYTILVVDNGSTDDSVARIRAAYPSVALIETGENLGYAGGNNVGIWHALDAGADYVCILNNDIVVAPGFLEPLVEATVGADESIAITSPAVCEGSRPSVIWCLGAGIVWRDGSVFRMHSGEAYSVWAGEPPFEADYVPGSAMLVPRQAWEQVGMISEDYFLYYEEADWCVHARRAGFRILAVPGAVVWHNVEAHEGRSSPSVTYYMTRNALLFLQRNLLPTGSSMVPISRAALMAQFNVLGDLRRGQVGRALSRVRGVVDYFRGRMGPLR